MIQGKRVAGKPLSNRRRTCRENCWKTAGKPLAKPLAKPLENRWKTVGKPLENRRQAAGKLPGNRRRTYRENRPETAGKSPVFGRLLPVSIRDWNGLEGPLRRHFSGCGGGCHKGTTSQAQRMYSSIRWGWWNGDLWVFRRDEGPSRSDEGFCGISRIAHA